MWPRRHYVGAAYLDAVVLTVLAITVAYTLAALAGLMRVRAYRD